MAECGVMTHHVAVNKGKTGKEYAKVTLTYKYSVPLLSVNKTNEIVGYAR